MQDEDALSYDIVRGLCFLSVIFAPTISNNILPYNQVDKLTREYDEIIRQQSNQTSPTSEWQMRKRYRLI